MEKVTINFSSYDLDGNYSEMILDSVKNHLFTNRDIAYIFPQITKWWPWLKNKVANWLSSLDIKWDYNVWFMSTKTQEAIFQILIINS